MATSVIYIVIPLMTLSGSLDVLIILMCHQEVGVEVRIISSIPAAQTLTSILTARQVCVGNLTLEHVEYIIRALICQVVA